MTTCLVVRHLFGDAVVDGEQLGDAEVEHLGEVGIARPLDQEDIVRLEVAVDDAAGMGRGQRMADALHDVERARERRPRLGEEQLRERAPLEPLHHEIGGPVLELPEVEDLDDVLAADVARGLGLAEEAGDHLRVTAALRVEELDRDPPIDAGVLGQVDGAHPAFADLLPDDVVADRASEHGLTS